MRVLLQAGHHPNAGGAPGEAAWTHKLALLIAERLTARGVHVAIVGDWYGKPPPVQVYQDWDLFLALHYDAAIYGARGEANSGAFCDRAQGDPVWQASNRFIALWEAVYPEATRIPLANHRRNSNTWAYYGFAATTARTPGVLIEHGCGAPVGTGGFPPGDDAAFLHEQIETVADADAAAVLAFLGILGGGAGRIRVDENEERSRLAAVLAAQGVTDVKTMSDEQAEKVGAELWGSKAPFSLETGIGRAYIEDLKAGHYRGQPTGGEKQLGDGVVVQRFKKGSAPVVAVYAPESGAGFAE